MVKTRANLHQIGNALLIVGVIILLVSSSVRTRVTSTLQSWLLQTGLMDAEVTAPAVLGRVDQPLALETLAGEPLDPGTLAGKTIFLHVWASWCPPCIAEFPDLQQLVQSTPTDEVAFLLVSVDKNPNKARQFLQKRGYADLPVYRLTEQLPASVQYRVIPTTYLIAPSGEIIYKHEGLAQYNHEEFRQFLQEDRK